MKISNKTAAAFITSGLGLGLAANGLVFASSSNDNFTPPTRKLQMSMNMSSVFEDSAFEDCENKQVRSTFDIIVHYLLIIVSE